MTDAIERLKRAADDYEGSVNGALVNVADLRTLLAALTVPGELGAIGDGTCAHCNNPATCIGRYEVCEGPREPACDDCCGHGNEDGSCEPIAPLLAAAVRALSARVQRVEAAMNKRRSGDDCGCFDCTQIVSEHHESKPTCETCGYAGRPVALECACYDRSCSPHANGSGCAHGAVVCPVCDDGEELLTIVRDVRAALKEQP